MKWKILIALVLSLVYSPVLCAQSTAIINGPTQAAPGDLVILDASASDCDALTWSLANSDKSFLPVEAGTKCVFASGQSGPYVFILATAKGDADGTATVAIAKHVLQIGDLPDPNPNPPGPAPPGPRPPQPPPTPPEPDLLKLAKESYEKAKSVSRQPGEAQRLATVMQTISSKAAGLSWSVPEIAQQLQQASREQIFTSEEVKGRWLSYQQWFGDVLQREVQTSDDAIRVLSELAEGLLACESSRQVQLSTDPPNESIKEMIHSLKSHLESLKNEVGQ